MPPILFATESAQSRSPPLNSQRLINMMVERAGPDAKGPSPIFGVPGIRSFSTPGVGPIRGVWQFAGKPYVVSGQQLYRVETDGSSNIVSGGLLIGGFGPVGMSDNGTQLCIVNGLSGFIYTKAHGLQPITDPDFYPAATVIFMDGYFVFDRLGTNEYFLSNLYDGLTYNGLDFASAEARPGTLTTIFQNLQLLFIFCIDHIEIWYDAGSPIFPFQRYAGGVINYGCISPFTVIGQDGAIFFLGTDKIFYRLQANVPIRVSTHAMEHIIALDPDITQATCTTLTIEGHKLVILHLVASAQTLIFDISTGKWHERESWGPNNVSYGLWRGAWALEINQQILIGDAIGNQVGILDWTVNTEYGNTIRALARSAPLHHDKARIFVSRLELDVQAGVGKGLGGTGPKIMMRYSRDGGQTWSIYQKWRSLGQIGVYLQRVRWLRLGSGYQYIFEVTITENVPRVIIAAHADMEVGV